MRIIGGEHRGRRLTAPAGDHTRPTADKVREALFDILGSAVEGSRFADVYAGTGAVGLEALSRGAESCVFVEVSGKALAFLNRNISLLGAEDRARILALAAKPAVEILAREEVRLDVLFADPPYADAQWPALLERLASLPGLLAPGAFLVVEHGAKGLPACPAGCAMKKSYRYGDTGLTVFVKDAPEAGHA